ncbi:MAG: 23S rRNA (pseudouridine(1915)-N(3))-methyltransferase RlmH [Bacillota bacterium]
MKITVVQVGKTREKTLADAAAEYRRRLRPYAQVEHVTAADEPEPPAAGPNT